MNKLLNKFEIVKCLGQGSLGLVYLCRHPEVPGQECAVKVLHDEISKDKQAVARLRHHATVAFGIQHPNVVRHWEYLNDAGIAALTMEYVDGGDLSELMSPRECFSIAESMRIVSQICAGLQAIHDAGVIHRNIKPENILFIKDGTVKIADFCCSVCNGQKLDESLGVSGSIDLVSPEYMATSQIDKRGDIYALGCLAYEMLTGRSPFLGNTVYETMTKRLNEDPAPPRTFNTACPLEVDAIVLKAMARDINARYQTADELRNDIQKISNLLDG